MSGLSVLFTHDQQQQQELSDRFLSRNTNQLDPVLYQSDFCLVTAPRQSSLPISVTRHDRFTMIVEGMNYERSNEDCLTDLLGFFSGQMVLDEAAYSSWISKQFGEFLIVLIDTTQDQVIIFNDVFARLSTFFYQEDAFMMLSRDLGAVQAVARQKKDLMACAQFALVGYSLKDRSFYEGIRRVKAASLLDVSPGQFRYQPFVFDFDYSSENGLSIQENARDLAQIFTNSVLSSTRHFDRRLLSLSGGLDSRSILAVLLSHDISFQGVTCECPYGTADADIDQIKKIHSKIPFDWTLFSIPQLNQSDYSRLFNAKHGLNFLTMAYFWVFLEQVKLCHSAFRQYLTGDKICNLLGNMGPEIEISSIDQLIFYTVYKEQLLPVSMVARLFGVSKDDLLSDFYDLYSSYSEDQLSTRYKRYLMTQRAPNWLFEGEDRNRSLLYSHSPFFHPVLVQRALYCPDQQKRYQRLRYAVLKELHDDISRFNDVTYGHIDNSGFVAKQGARRLVKRGYLLLPDVILEKVKQARHMNSHTAILPGLMSIMMASIQLNSQNRVGSMVDQSFLSDLLQNHQVSQPQAELLLGVLMMDVLGE